ncbi:MAG: aminoacetone oxidase family FAD-binding enzyme [Gemmatimonadota bacterium]
MIVVLGAGAAGLMAAIHAVSEDSPVVVLERTADGGRKILISGGGRCNVLPSTLDERRFVTASSPRTLANLLRAWPLSEQRHFFETTLRVPLTLEPETGKLFPVSNRARDVRDRLVAEARRRGAQFRFGVSARALEPAPDGRWRVTLDSGEVLVVTAVIFATGGLSVPATGSDGTGLEIARSLGHGIHATYPALTPLVADPAPHTSLAGVSLPVILRGSDGGRAVTAEGGFLFTHRGYSGPVVLDLSHLAVRSRLAGGPNAALRVQWTGRDAVAWDERLRSPSRESVFGALRESIPARLAEWLLSDAGIDRGRELAQLRREERVALVSRLAAYELPWTSDEGYKKAEVTGGGVALSEVEPATLESKRHPGLFFSGEILDAFGPIGGYNFAWAWATGRTAGLGANRAARRQGGKAAGSSGAC